MHPAQVSTMLRPNPPGLADIIGGEIGIGDVQSGRHRLKCTGVMPAAVHKTLAGDSLLAGTGPAVTIAPITPMVNDE
jgi:hypothetical protein